MFNICNLFRKKEKNVNCVYTISSAIGENCDCFLASDFQLHSKFKLDFELELKYLIKNYRIKSINEYSKENIIVLEYSNVTIITTKNKDFLKSCFCFTEQLNEHEFYDILTNKIVVIEDLAMPHKKVFITKSTDRLNMNSINMLIESLKSS